MPQQARLLDHLQALLGKLIRHGLHHGDIPVIRQLAEAAQGSQVQTRRLEEETLLHLADHNDLAHVVVL